MARDFPLLVMVVRPSKFFEEWELKVMSKTAEAAGFTFVNPSEESFVCGGWFEGEDCASVTALQTLTATVWQQVGIYGVQIKTPRPPENFEKQVPKPEDSTPPQPAPETGSEPQAGDTTVLQLGPPDMNRFPTPRPAKPNSGPPPGMDDK